MTGQESERIEQEIERTTGWTLWAYTVLLYFGLAYSGFTGWLNDQGLVAVIVFFIAYSVLLFFVTRAAVDRVNPLDAVLD